MSASTTPSSVIISAKIEPDPSKLDPVYVHYNNDQSNLLPFFRSGFPKRVDRQLQQVTEEGGARELLEILVELDRVVKARPYAEDAG